MMTDLAGVGVQIRQLEIATSDLLKSRPNQPKSWSDYRSALAELVKSRNLAKSFSMIVGMRPNIESCPEDVQRYIENAEVVGGVYENALKQIAALRRADCGTGDCPYCTPSRIARQALGC